MAHSSFIDCDDNNILNDNFLSTVKVELDNSVVNDDENVAVEALGQLSSYDVGGQPSFHIKQEDDYTIVEAVTIEECIVPDVNAFVDAVFERPYICDICGIRFKFDDVLAEHKKIHIPVEKPYECHSCSVSFHRKSSLKNHAKIHTNKSLMIVEEDVIEEERRDRIPPFETLRPVCEENVMTFEDWAPVGPNSDSQVVIAAGVECSINEDVDGHTLHELSAAAPSGGDYDEGVSVNKENDSHENNKFKPYSCPFCERSFAREKALFNHVRMHNDNYDECLESGLPNKPQQIERRPVVEEEQQQVQLMRPEDIKTEELDESGSSRVKPYECPICNRSFARQKALANHLRIHNDNYEPALQCQTCHDIFPDASTLRAHTQVCTPNVMHFTAAVKPADVGGEEDEQDYTMGGYFEDDVSLKQEILSGNVLGSGNHECHVCRKRFKTRQKVFRHLWVHRQKLHSCEVCSAQFGTVARLDEHRLQAHPSTAPFSCEKCGKSFTSKQGLTEHMRLHTGQSGQYFCADCDKRFSSRQGFTIHGRIHSGERPYGCRFCTKAFRDGGTLKKHERIHTGERPHECPLCHKCYNQKVVLREHIRAVHVVRLPKDSDGRCPVCRLDGMRRDELSEHIVRHSDELKWRRNSRRDDSLKLLESPLARVTKPRRGRKRKPGKRPPKRSSSPPINEHFSSSHSTPPQSPPPPINGTFLDDDNNTTTSNPNNYVRESCPDKPFECEMCHLSFADRTELVAHVLVHI